VLKSYLPMCVILVSAIEWLLALKSYGRRVGPALLLSAGVVISAFKCFLRPELLICQNSITASSLYSNRAKMRKIAGGTRVHG
jgi:hypothetical protein